jgi:hypothetical protein
MTKLRSTISRLCRRVVPLLVFLPGIVFPTGKAFSQLNDFQLWTTVNFEKKISPAFSALLTQEIRFSENVTQVGTVFTEIGASYRFLKRFKVTAMYRITHKEQIDKTYDDRTRYYFDFTYKEKIKPVVLVARLRYQAEYKDYNTSETGKVPEIQIVPKLEVKFDLKKRYEPYVYAEPFFRMTQIVYAPFDQLRVCAGVEYTINRMNSIDIHYLIEKEYNVKHPETDYVIGITYDFTF